MVREKEVEEGQIMRDNEWWRRGSFKTRDMDREAGKDLKRGLVVMGGEQGTGQASYTKKCKKKVLVVFDQSRIQQIYHTKKKASI